MPSRHIPGKQRRAWRMSDLSASDVLSLACGWPPPASDSVVTAFTCLEDVREAWEALRERFLVMQTWDAGPEVDLLAAHRPGQRPWAWWVFDSGREMPRDQPRVLRRLGLLNAAEQEEMRVWDSEVRRIGYRSLRDFYSIAEGEDS